MFPQNLIRHGVNNLNLLLNSCSRLPFVGLQRFMNTNAEKSIDTQNSPEYDTLYKRIVVEARCADQAVLDSYEEFVRMAANNLDVKLNRVWSPFRSIKRKTLLRAAFVKKKYRVQYETRTYFRSMEFKYLTGSTADTFLEYIERNIPEGVLAKVTKERIEEIFEALRKPESTNNEQLQQESLQQEQPQPQP